MSEHREDRAQTLGEETSADVSPRPLRSQADFTANLTDFIARSPGIFGCADILSVDYLHPLERAGILAGILTRILTADHAVAVRSILIVAPPETDLSMARSRSWSAMIATLHTLHGGEVPENAEAWLDARFNVISAPDLITRSLLRVIAEQPDQAAVIVTSAAKYRAANIAPYIEPPALTPRLLEDVWVPQIHALANAAMKVAGERNVYVALDTGQMSPRRPANQTLLTSIAGCGVMGSSNDGDPLTVVGDRISYWDQQVREGHLDLVLREIEELPPPFRAEKAFLRVQLLYRAGRWNEALHAIREELTLGLRQPDGSASAKLARIAQVAGDSTLAMEILSPAVDELDSLEDLESALATAHDAKYRELEDRVAARLATLFPGSPGIRARQQRIMAAAGDYSGIVEMLICEANDPAEVDLVHGIARFLSVTDTPDYVALIASAIGDPARSEALRMACVQDTLQRGWIQDAFELALPLPETPHQSRRGEQSLLKVLEAIFLRAQTGHQPVSEERISAALLSLIDRLAADQTNHRLRVGVVGLLQLSVAGHTGLALIASIVLKLALMPTTIMKRKVAPGPEMEWLTQHHVFMHVALTWLKSQEPVVIGHLIFPESLLTEPADDIVSALTKYLDYAPISDEDDIVSLRTYLTLAITVTPYSTDPDQDIKLIRLVAAKMASSGYAQVGRDLAETALQNSTASLSRRRLGWFAMADVYHRCHNHIEASVALACALAISAAVDEEQAWYEANMLARLFRDCHLYGLARIAISQCHQRLADMELTEAYSHRLDTIELQIRQQEFDWRGDNRAELEALMNDTVQNGAVTLERNDEAAPAAFLVGNMISIGKKLAAEVPFKANAVFAELCQRSGGNFSSLAKAFSSDFLFVTELFNLVKARNFARYSDDVGYDMRDIAIVAGRAIASEDYIQSAVDTSLALELMADRGVAVPGWDDTAEPPAAPTRIEEPAEIACSLSGQGLSVVQVAFDSNGRLVRLSAVGGQLELPVREPDEIIQEKRFQNWALKYPYQYGIDDTSPNLFYTTTADLRLSELPHGPVLIVADATLQPFPPNILFLGDDFSGRTRPMASAPSLAWVKAAQERQPLGDGRLCAWISSATSNSESATLSMIADRLNPTLTQHGFIVDKGATLPANFKGATMAVMTAHGGIHQEDGFFQVVSDEGVLRVTPNGLAAALRNVGTVVLFVCSGGRTDKHPHAHTTLGLARRILDQGCEAVIASPWPLDSRVPSHWLPTFLEQWAMGEPLIQANFKANKVVDRCFSLDPARGLAMTVIGNPLVRRHVNQ